ncbi:cation transporter [Negadavirga shengliensis]|uniref:Cation transporter n=1 Tax=Negadavirga shengliensis TaxID=1389218 RepID=A0ABV9T1K2_9BACT
MEKTYKISGMTCQACTRIVHHTILGVKGVKKATLDLSTHLAIIDMDENVDLAKLQDAFTKADSLYQIWEMEPGSAESHPGPWDTTAASKDLVTAYISAVGKLDHQQLEKHLHPSFTYKGPITCNSAQEYIQLIEEHANSPVASILVKNNIQAIFVDGDESCVIYDSESRFPDLKVPFVEWIKIKEGKIAATQVKFNRQQMKLLMQEVRKNQTRS